MNMVRKKIKPKPLDYHHKAKAEKLSFQLMVAELVEKIEHSVDLKVSGKVFSAAHSSFYYNQLGELCILAY